MGVEKLKEFMKFNLIKSVVLPVSKAGPGLNLFYDTDFVCFVYLKHLHLTQQDNQSVTRRRKIVEQ